MHERIPPGTIEPRCHTRSFETNPVLPSLKTDKSPLKTRYAQLLAKGKPPKLALTALMRTSLVTLYAILRAKASWNDPRQS